MERVVLNALTLAAAGSLSDIYAFGDSAFIVLRTRRSTSPLLVDIATPEFSLRLRHFSGLCRCKLWPQNEKLIFENDFNARGNRRDSDRAKPQSGRERARRVTFITSVVATLMEEARRNRCWGAKARTSTR